MWDNRGNKKNAKAPDYWCKDKSCLTDGFVTGAWEEKPKHQAAGPGAPAAPRGPKWTWPQLSLTYERCLLLARKHIAEASTKEHPATMADILSATATLFIAATRDGVAEPVRPKPPVAPAPEPVPEGTANEDDVPW